MVHRGGFAKTGVFVGFCFFFTGKTERVVSSDVSGERERGVVGVLLLLDVFGEISKECVRESVVESAVQRDGELDGCVRCDEKGTDGRNER